MRKRDSVSAYRSLIHDEWTPLLAQIDARCRSAWGYRISPTSAEQAELRTILCGALAFENHFLDCYRHFLLTQLTRADQEAQQAARDLL